MDLSDSERAYLEDMRSLTTDSAGLTCFVGLSREESIEFHALVHKQGKAHGEKARYLTLHEKHEIARLAVLGTMAALRNNPQPLH